MATIFVLQSDSVTPCHGQRCSLDIAHEIKMILQLKTCNFRPISFSYLVCLRPVVVFRTNVSHLCNMIILEVISEKYNTLWIVKANTFALALSKTVRYEFSLRWIKYLAVKPSTGEKATCSWHPKPHCSPCAYSNLASVKRIFPERRIIYKRVKHRWIELARVHNSGIYKM